MSTVCVCVKRSRLYICSTVVDHKLVAGIARQVIVVATYPTRATHPSSEDGATINYLSSGKDVFML